MSSVPTAGQHNWPAAYPNASRFPAPILLPHTGPAQAQGPQDQPAVWLIPVLTQNLTLCPFSPPFHFWWGRGGGDFQDREEKDNEDPLVLSFAQAVASMHVKSTQEISQNPAAFNS